MEILDARDFLNRFSGKTIEVHTNEIKCELISKTRYSMPLESGRQMALAKLFVYMFDENIEVLLYITDWGINLTAEHLDLFYGYRMSMGESRNLIDAPVHIFDKGKEEDKIISVLSMVLFFCWDACLFDVSGNALMKFSHDGWFEFGTRTRELADQFDDYMKEYGVVPCG